MRIRSAFQAFTVFALVCTSVSIAEVQSTATPSKDGTDAKAEHVSFSTEDGATIAADLYGQGDRGVVLAHGGRFTKESWRPQAEELVRSGYRVLAFDFRGFGKSHGPGDADMFAAPMHLDVLGAVRYLRRNGSKSVAVIGGSFGGSAAADALIAAKPGEIDRLVLLAADGNMPAEKINVPLLEIVAQDDTNDEGPRLPHIRDWFNKVPQPKELIVLKGSAHAQFLFQTDQSDRVMEAILKFLAGR